MSVLTISELSLYTELKKKYKKEVLAIIPARGGSKRLPGKNIKLICGKPLIAWTIEAAKRCPFIDRVFVSTDSEEIASVARQYGAEVPFLRNVLLAQDKTSSPDVLENVLFELKKREGYVPDYICMLQATSPLRTEKHLCEAFKLMLDNNTDSCVSVVKAHINPYYANIIVDGYKYVNYIPNTGRAFVATLKQQDIYFLNGGLYFIKTTVFLKNKLLESDHCAAYVMADYDSVDVDTLNDFEFAEFLMRKKGMD